jgi:hypothetical protein
VTHNGTTAGEAGSIFLGAIYKDHDYERALNLVDLEFRKTVTAANFKELDDLVQKHCGTLQELEADSYMMAQGMIHVFFVETCDNGTMYHMVVVTGDVASGYRAAGVWFRDTPYPQQQTATKFAKPIMIR